MSALTKENAKYHCRTCLRKINTERSTVENQYDSEKLGAEDIKDFGINITTNKELHYLLMNCAYDQLSMDGVHYLPQNVCITCYDKLQSFKKFCEQALESVKKLKTIFSDTKDDGSIEFEYITKIQRNERIPRRDHINQSLLKKTLLAPEAGLLGNNQLATLNNIQITEIIENNTFKANESARVSSDCLDWEENVQNEVNISNNSIKNESQNSREKPFSATAGAVKMDFEFMGNEQQQETNISRNDFYESLHTFIKSETVSLDNNSLNNVQSVPFETTETTANNNLVMIESTRANLDISDLKDHKEVTSNTITFKNNLNNSEISECESHADITAVKDSLTSSSTDSEDCCLAEVALETQSQNRRLQKNSDNSSKKQYTRKEMEILHHNSRKKKSFKCVQCNRNFASKINLDAHVRKVHEGNKRPFQCDRCDKSYTFFSSLNEHIKEIHETKNRFYSCDYSGCNRMYTSFRAFKAHKQKKHSESAKKHVCEHCGAKFTEAYHLKIHIRKKHPTEAEKEEQSKEIYECENCSKILNSRYTLKYHTLQQHSSDMKYKCSVCGLRMAKQFMLGQHMLMHSNNKTPCEHCGMEFVRKYQLEKHIRIVHMKQKPFKCQYCSESFALKGTLTQHEYKHTGEKPYVCDICGLAYRHRYSLYNHSKSHKKLNVVESSQQT